MQAARCAAVQVCCVQQVAVRWAVGDFGEYQAEVKNAWDQHGRRCLISWQHLRLKGTVVLRFGAVQAPCLHMLDASVCVAWPQNQQLSAGHGCARPGLHASELCHPEIKLHPFPGQGSRGGGCFQGRAAGEVGVRVPLALCASHLWAIDHSLPPCCACCKGQTCRAPYTSCLFAVV